MPAAPPPSSIIPPPVESGTGKYLAVILLLGGGMVGLFLWHKSQAEQPIVVPSPSASAAIAAAHAPHDEPIDIPPPPPIVPDAAPDTPVKPTGAGAGGANWGDGCAQTTCGGRITPELSSALAFRAKTAHRCYDEALAQDPTLKGQVVLSVKIGNNGNVCSASVASNDLANPSVGSCIANKFRQGLRLPSPLGGCLEANVPMQLQPAH